MNSAVLRQAVAFLLLASLCLAPLTSVAAAATATEAGAGSGTSQAEDAPDVPEDGETSEGETGDVETGETEAGETESGDGKAGETEQGDKTGETEQGDTESDGTESDDDKSDETETEDAEEEEDEEEDDGLTLTETPETICFGEHTLRQEETLYRLDSAAREDLRFEVSNPWGESWSLFLEPDSGFYDPEDDAPVEGLELVLVDRDGEVFPLKDGLPLFEDEGGDETAAVMWDDFEYDIQVLARPGLKEGVEYEARFYWTLEAD